MHLFGSRELDREKSEPAGNRLRQGNAGRLRAAAILMLGLSTAVPPGMAQQTAPQQGNKVLNEMPSNPTPVSTEPLFLRDTVKDYAKGHGLNLYGPVSVPQPNFMNSVRLTDLVKDGKIYLSLSDAITLALENNYDLAIARYNLDIADTDIMRTKAGSVFRGVNSGLVTGTLGGSSQTLTVGSGPGGTAAGAATGASGLVVSTDAAGPAPENLDPYITGTLQFDRASSPVTNFFSGGTSTTDTYNFGYYQGFTTGTAFSFVLDNQYSTTTNKVSEYSPGYTSSYKAQATQHLLQGFGTGINKRFIQEAIYDRRITDSGFRLQILYTVNQIENIYWSLVSSYEDLQARERAVEQSSKVAADDRKQLEIGTMAPLDVVTADSSVAADQQALISSQSNLKYQQLLMKQAIARNLSDPALVAAPIIPTDRVSLDELPEEKQTADELAQVAFQQRPELEQAVLSLKKDEITLKGTRNGLLPVVDAFAYISGQGAVGTINPACIASGFCTTPYPPTGGYGTALQDTFNNTSPDKGVGFNLTIPLRNRTAQADQARSVIEYRQAQLRLEQLYTEIKMQVVNQQYALANDRAAVLAAEASQRFNAQSFDSETKKLHLGASTTALVLQQSRNLATAENSLTSARAAYAKDRAALYQLLATTLQHYGISLGDAATGTVTMAPLIPGLEAAKDTKEPTIPTKEQQQNQEQQIKQQNSQPAPKPQ
jgi:outer membrane protein